MMTKPTWSELQRRIEEIARFHGGAMPRDDAVAWAGYLAALLEWGLIEEDVHGRLQDALGGESAGPTLAIFLGPEAAKAIADGHHSAPRMAAAGVG